MPDDASSRFLLHLVTQGPMLFAYLLGLLAAGRCYRACPAAARYVLLACSLMLLAGTVNIAFGSFPDRANEILSLEMVRQLTAAARALGVILVLVAILHGRSESALAQRRRTRRPPPDPDEDVPRRPGEPPPLPDPNDPEEREPPPP